MRCIATFDIGTTAVKAVLVDMDGQVLLSDSRDIPTIYEGPCREQDPAVWWDAFCEISQNFLTEGRDIAGIVMSGQMQDVIPVDETLMPVRNAILYSDGRGAPQAQRLAEAVGAEEILRITGNGCDGSLSLPKIMWMKENEPELYARTRCFLISSKDYGIARLTGECASDLTACSTACAMDLRTKQWSEPILKAAGLEASRLPRLCASHEYVGGVTEAAAEKAGYAIGTPVYAGVGDAGATTLASGIMDAGQYNINLGTSGWVATVSDQALFTGGGVFNLAAMPVGKVINVVPFLNASNVHRWLSVLLSGEEGKPDYENINRLLSESSVGAGGVMALPYLVGERFPVLDADARGAFVGLTPETTQRDLVRSMLEGVGFSIRQGVEAIGQKPSHISIIGGGGRVTGWCQILSDILGQTIYVYRNADTLPARAIAAAVLIGQNLQPDYTAFVQGLQQEGSADVFHPDVSAHAQYDALYARYVQLYPILKQWYELNHM